MPEGRGFVGEAVRNSGCAAVAGCLWVAAACFVVPMVWFGMAYDYRFSDWLSLLSYSDAHGETFFWFARTAAVLVLIGATLFLLAFAVLRGSADTEE